MKLELLAKCLNELIKDRPEFADKDICIEQTSNNESKIYVAQYDETSKSWTKLYWIRNLDTIKESIKQNMKKTYKIKNYKGNLVESLEKFSKKYEGMRVVEASEKDGALNIVAEESNSESVFDVYDEYHKKLEAMKAHCEQLLIYLDKAKQAVNKSERTADDQGNIDIFNSLQKTFLMKLEKTLQFVNDNNLIAEDVLKVKNNLDH